jgi:hypothetical protein
MKEAKDGIIQKGGNRTKALWRGILIQIWRKPFFKEIEMESSEPEPITDVPDFNASQWIIAWLALGNRFPIKGKTVFVKQLFVTGKELVPHIDHLFGFFPHRFGPYSFVFDSALKEVVEKGFVEVTPHQESADDAPIRPPRLDYRLSPAGEIEASRLFGKIPEESWIALEQYRKMLSRMGFWGLLTYVYSNYPQYTMFSEIDPLNKEG